MNELVLALYKARYFLATMWLYAYVSFIGLLFGIFVLGDVIAIVKIQFIITFTFCSIFAGWWFIRQGNWYTIMTIQSLVYVPIILTNACFPEASKYTPYLYASFAGIFPLLCVIFAFPNKESTK